MRDVGRRERLGRDGEHRHEPAEDEQHQGGEGWGGYTVDETAFRHGAGVERETTEPAEAYARVPKREPARYRDGWL